MERRPRDVRDARPDHRLQSGDQCLDAAGADAIARAGIAGATVLLGGRPRIEVVGGNVPNNNLQYTPSARGSGTPDGQSRRRARVRESWLSAEWNFGSLPRSPAAAPDPVTGRRRAPRSSEMPARSYPDSSHRRPVALTRLLTRGGCAVEAGHGGTFNQTVDNPDPLYHIQPYG